MNTQEHRFPIQTPVLVLIGPTAIGKTDLSLELAQQFGCEIISMDSMQVYRYMDIGTAKVSQEEQQKIPHHLIDIVDPDDAYDAARFVKDTLACLETIAAKGNIPLLTGGTGMYLTALVNGLFEEIAVPTSLRYALKKRLEEEGRDALFLELQAVDPQTCARIHRNDTQRLLRALEIFHASGIPWSEHLRQQQAQKIQQAARFNRLCLMGLTCEREALYQRITVRTGNMMQQPFQQEVETLLNRGYSPDLASMQAIGYRHMISVIQGQENLQAATDTLIRDTRRYAKRQLTWFRHHHDIQWFQRTAKEQIIKTAADFLTSRSSS